MKITFLFGALLATIAAAASFEDEDTPMLRGLIPQCHEKGEVCDHNLQCCHVYVCRTHSDGVNKCLRCTRRGGSCRVNNDCCDWNYCIPKKSGNKGECMACQKKAGAACDDDADCCGVMKCGFARPQDKIGKCFKP